MEPAFWNAAANMSKKTPPATASPANATILRDVFKMSTTARFFYLLQHANSLIQCNGPYTTFVDTTVFTRTRQTQPRMNAPSTKELAVSLAAAQDSIGTAQLDSPAKEDLMIFKHLWDATTALLDDMLEAGNLDHESFGWGVYGLAAGYTPPLSESQGDFLSQKARLHDALLALPSMGSPERKREEIVVKGERRVEVLVKARRQVHICANLLVQQFREENWYRVRWGHGVKVAERWAQVLGLTTENGDRTNGIY
jgi:hypothetical protein